MFKLRRYRLKFVRWANDFAQFTPMSSTTAARSRAEVMATFLYGLSFLFSGIVQLRWYLYEHRILRNRPLGCLVVVVGNLTVGGTGKTPVVENLPAP